MVISRDRLVKAPLAQLIQNGFTGEAKAGEARKIDFSWLIVHFNPNLQNDFTLQCLDLRKIDKAEVDLSRTKRPLISSPKSEPTRKVLGQ